MIPAVEIIAPSFFKHFLKVEFWSELFYLYFVKRLLPSGREMKFITGFGALNLDLIFEVDDFKTISTRKVRLRPGKEIFGSDEDFEAFFEALHRFGSLRSKSGGGSAANTIVALGRMGFPARLIGKVGEDQEGDFILKDLGPVGTDWIRRGEKSGICFVVLDRNQDRFLFVRGNANDRLTIDEIDLGQANQIAWVHLTSFVGEAPFEAQKRLIAHLDPSVKVSMDPGEIYAAKGLDRIRPLVQRSCVLFLTERELNMLAGQDIPKGSRKLMAMGPEIVVCKRGRQGSIVVSREKQFEIPAPRVEVRDNTGAGDVYNAGFLAGLLLGRSLEESARFATRIAGKSLTGYGRDKYPTREDLESFFGGEFSSDLYQ
jgi:ribokinase